MTAYQSHAAIDDRQQVALTVVNMGKCTAVAGSSAVHLHIQKNQLKLYDYIANHCAVSQAIRKKTLGRHTKWNVNYLRQNVNDSIKTAPIMVKELFLTIRT